MLVRKELNDDEMSLPPTFQLQHSQGYKVKLPSQMKKNLRGPTAPPNSLAGMEQGFVMMYHLPTVGCSPVVGQEIHGTGSLRNPT